MKRLAVGNGHVTSCKVIHIKCNNASWADICASHCTSHIHEQGVNSFLLSILSFLSLCCESAHISVLYDYFFDLHVSTSWAGVTLILLRSFEHCWMPVGVKLFA